MVASSLKAPASAKKKGEEEAERKKEGKIIMERLSEREREKGGKGRKGRVKKEAIKN